MKHAESVVFGGGGLKRAAELRADAAAMEQLRARDDSRVLPLWRGKPLMQEQGHDLNWLPLSHPFLANTPGRQVFLGLNDQGGGLFAQDVSDWPVPDDQPQPDGRFLDLTEQHVQGTGGRFVELRSMMVQLSPLNAEIIVTAKSVLGWHTTHGFCSTCGAPSTAVKEGWERHCPACGRSHFPRTDPVVIMLITRGEEVLLGRSPGWPEGMYSLLAGFVEPGETIEAAVRREVWEEAGVLVGQVEYLSSQPWPFPASLMLGCRGEALSHEITLDPVELEDAMWMSRQDLMAAFAGRHPKVAAARKGAIAHFLMRHWLADTLD